MVVRDSTQKTDAAQDALRSLVDEEHVIGVIGPLLSRIAIELAPLAGQFGVPLISPYARDSDFPALSAYAMRNSLTDTLQGRFLAEYAINVLKLTRFVILHPEDAYGTALRDRFREQVLQRQGEIVAVVSYPPNSTNIGRVLGRLKELQYDAIFLPEYAAKVSTIVTQLATQNIKGMQLLGTDGLECTEAGGQRRLGCWRELFLSMAFLWMLPLLPCKRLSSSSAIVIKRPLIC